MRSTFITPRPFDEVVAECNGIAQTRGIAVLVPGDLHLWGAPGGNRSDLFVELMQRVGFSYLLTNGDLFEGYHPARQTEHDASVLTHIQELDREARWIAVRGNHDRRIFTNNIRHRGHESEPDLSWLYRERISNPVCMSIVDGDVYHNAAPTQDVAPKAHPGSHDVVMLTVSGKNFLFEHGDRYDVLGGTLAARDDLATKVASAAYNLLVSLEKTHERVGDTIGTFKRSVSKWRGVGRSVAEGVTRQAQALTVPIHGTVSGHTHYPLHTVVDGIPHVNVGSFRGRRPSFAVITGDGELLPPFVIRT